MICQNAKHGGAKNMCKKPKQCCTRLWILHLSMKKIEKKKKKHQKSVINKHLQTVSFIRMLSPPFLKLQPNNKREKIKIKKKKQKESMNPSKKTSQRA